MKTVNFFLSLLFGFILSAQSQTITVLSKEEVYKSPIDEMIVMDKYTFAKYHYTAEKYDTLKKEIKELDSLIQEKEITHSLIIQDYETILKTKDQETGHYREAYSNTKGLLETSIDKNNQLIVEYKKLENRRNKTKRWRNVFFGSTVFSTTILILIVAL